MESIIMTKRTFPKIMAALFLAATVIPFATIAAQAPAADKKEKKPKDPNAEKKPKDPGVFFNSEEPVSLTITTNISRIRKDKGDNSPWRPATISYTDAAGKTIAVPATLKTRGIWRRKNCDFPPIRLNFKRDSTKGTLLQGLDQPKLVNYCRDDDVYEQYLLQELQLYRVYNQLTPMSHKMRLLQVTYVDSATGKAHAKRYALLQEEPGALADRLKGPRLKLTGATPDDMEPFYNALVGVFQYLIGNTDWSIAGLHNIELMAQPDGRVIPVAFDFDFSGAVNARYATVDPSLTVRRVRERLYRGYCGPEEEYSKVFALFNEKKPAIYALYTDSIGKLMSPRIVKETMEYFDEFYKTINDSRRAKREIAESCLGR